MIDQEDWKMYKKKEKAELEPKVAKPVMEVNENDEETTIVLEEEIDFGIVEARSKINKRKNDESGQPPKKRKIFENIVSCGDDDDFRGKDNAFLGQQIHFRAKDKTERISPGPPPNPNKMRF